MSEPFLIAHKVRGEPAFDVAERLCCPICEPIMQGLDYGTASNTCKECEGEGFWWIISTSGHRAKPYWSHPIRLLQFEDEGIGQMSTPLEPAATTLPPGWPDHYPINQPTFAPASAQSGADLLEELGL